MSQEMVAQSEATLFAVGELSVAEVVLRTEAAKVGVQELALVLWELRQHNNWKKHPKGHTSWEAFCNAELPYSRKWVNVLTDGYDSLSVLRPDQRKKITNAEQMKAIAAVPAHLRQQVVDAAIETAPPHPMFPNGKLLSGQHITRTAKDFLASPALIESDKSGTPVPQSEEKKDAPPPPMARYRSVFRHTGAGMVLVKFSLPGEKKVYEVAVPVGALLPLLTKG